MSTLKIIIASTRPQRKGLSIGTWFYNLAKERFDFETELLDLAKINLPFLDEPKHPRLRDYQHQHTKDWSKAIDEADMIVMVTPEYNYSFPAPLKNAIDFLSQEWADKPVGFVSYGGVSGGTRSVQALKTVVQAVGMVPVAEAVAIPAFNKFIDEKDVFNAEEGLVKAANGMLDSLVKWEGLLRERRGK